jgi:hypothetical protein
MSGTGKNADFDQEFKKRVLLTDGTGVDPLDALGRIAVIRQVGEKTKVFFVSEQLTKDDVEVPNTLRAEKAVIALDSVVDDQWSFGAKLLAMLGISLSSKEKLDLKITDIAQAKLGALSKKAAEVKQTMEEINVIQDSDSVLYVNVAVISTCLRKLYTSEGQQAGFLWGLFDLSGKKMYEASGTTTSPLVSLNGIWLQGAPAAAAKELTLAEFDRNLTRKSLAPRTLSPSA